MASLQTYFERFALVSLEKQELFFRLLGEHSLDLDLDAGIAGFSSGLKCRFQVLGTESDNTLNWLWGWADEQTEIPASLTGSCRELRSWAEKEQIPEFLSPSLDLDRADGNMMSLVACSLCNATAFYRDHYEGGTLFLLLFCEGMERVRGFDRSGLLKQLRELAQTYDMDIQNVLLSYFREKGLPVVDGPREISGELPSGERLVADLDDQGRICSINGEPFPAECSR